MRENQEILDLLNHAVDLAIQYGANLVGALIMLIGGWIVAGWVRRGVLRLLDRVRRVDETLKPVIASVARYSILIFRAPLRIGELPEDIV